MFEKYYEKVYQALRRVGEGGLTIGALAKAVGHSKSHTWKVAKEMVERELIYRRDREDTSYSIRVTYHYYQLPLFGDK